MSVRPAIRIGAACLLLAAIDARAEEVPPGSEAAPPGPAPAAAGEERPVSLSLESLGWNQQVKRNGTRASVHLPFSSRVDRLLLGGHLELGFASHNLRFAVNGLAIELNGEEIGWIPVRDFRGQAHIPVPSAYLSEHNVLTLRLQSEREDECLEVPPGTWHLIDRGTLHLSSVELPVPPDLSRLPLPWVDPSFDPFGEVPFVFASEPGTGELQAAAWIASWLGRIGGMPIRFQVGQGELPRAHSVVLVGSAAAASRLGLPEPKGPFLRVVDHPDSPHHLLVIEGRNEEELIFAARRLAEEGAPDARGQEEAILPGPSPAPLEPYHCARWALPGRDLRFGELMELAGDAFLEHRGSEPGNIGLRFRIPPDLFSWPGEWVDLEMIYHAEGIEESGPPRLDLEVNGHFVGRLPVGGSEGTFRRKLRIYRSHLQGYNHLTVHVSYPEGSCGLEKPRISLDPDSTLQLAEVRHFVELPNVKLFAYDGFPFTRMADLSETTLALPRAASQEEIGSALSWVAWFAAITGEGGTGLRVVALEELTSERPKGDVLIVSRAQRFQSYAERWNSPVVPDLHEGTFRLREPHTRAWIRDAAEGFSLRLERLRARDVLASSTGGSQGIVLGMESPWVEGRSVLVATGMIPSSIPDAVAVQGPAKSVHPGGDLLVHAGDRRWTFQTTAPYSFGDVPFHLQLRWQLATHWPLKLPLLFLGVLLAGTLTSRIVRRRERRRLSVEEGAGR